MSSTRRPATAARSRATRGRGLLLVTGALVVCGLIAVGVAVAQRDSPRALAASASGGLRGALPPVEFPEPGVVHVHGLGVDPGDGTLYAATHSGLFALPAAGQAQRIANRYQDTMGFTVTGPGTFLGSGHPDFREDDVRPPLLGLIESTDAGTSWERLSLHGKADFHALHAAHGRVYGYDSTSQTFLVSADKKSWDRRARLDFAVSPTDPETVLATTAQGLARSTDGGRSFALTPQAPPLAVLTWAGATLFGASPDGTVFVSSDGGTTWGQRGQAGGQPEAMTLDARAGSSTLYLAVAERGVLASSDGGRTFTVRYSEQART